MGESVLQVKDLHKSFSSHQVLRGVNLNLQAGSITGLLAKNGAGKSTLISLICGLLPADSGEISFSLEGKENLFRRYIGVAPQDTGVYPGLTLRENLQFAGRIYGLSGKQLDEATERTAELFGIQEYYHTPARNLSGGWKRRLHTAMAVLHKPRLLLLDEPTVGSDPLARKFILNAVKTLAAEGTAILYTGHYFPEFEELNAGIAILHNGRIVAENELDILLQKYGTPGIRVHFSATGAIGKEHIQQLFPLERADLWKFADNVLTIYTGEPESFFADITMLYQGKNSAIRKWEVLRADLESVYFLLTDAPIEEEKRELLANLPK
ncbi:MAG: ABC transporter ATP-binding protein [Spirochaetota bacterium]